MNFINIHEFKTESHEFSNYACKYASKCIFISGVAVLVDSINNT